MIPGTMVDVVISIYSYSLIGMYISIAYLKPSAWAWGVRGPAPCASWSCVRCWAGSSSSLACRGWGRAACLSAAPSRSARESPGEWGVCLVGNITVQKNIIFAVLVKEIQQYKKILIISILLQDSQFRTCSHVSIWRTWAPPPAPRRRRTGGRTRTTPSAAAACPAAVEESGFSYKTLKLSRQSEGLNAVQPKHHWTLG